MELIVFDPKKVLLYVLFYITGCGQITFQPSQNLDLNLPKEEKPKIIKQVKSTISVILLDEELQYCYTDSEISKGMLYPRKDFETLLKESKKKFGNSLLVLLKPTKHSSYKTTVNALDQMTIHKIKRFEMVALNKEEENFIYSSNFIQPPEHVEVTLPETVTSELVPEKGIAFYVHIKDDMTIWYKTDSLFNKDNYLKLNKPKEQTFEKLIAQFKEKCKQANSKILVYIMGDKNSKYKDFELVINSLKKNEIYKYQLITTDK